VLYDPDGLTEQDVALAVVTYWPAGHNEQLLPVRKVPGSHEMQRVELALAYEPDEQAVQATAEALEVVPSPQRWHNRDVAFKKVPAGQGEHALALAVGALPAGQGVQSGVLGSRATVPGAQGEQIGAG
jgi:hypothetical protein